MKFFVLISYFFLFFIPGPSQLTLCSSETLRHRLKDKIRMPRSAKSQRSSHQCGTCWRLTIKMWVWESCAPSFEWQRFAWSENSVPGLPSCHPNYSELEAKLHFQLAFNHVNSAQRSVGLGWKICIWEFSYPRRMKSSLPSSESWAINFPTFMHMTYQLCMLFPSNHVKLLCVQFDDGRKKIRCELKADEDRHGAAGGKKLAIWCWKLNFHVTIQFPQTACRKWKFFCLARANAYYRKRGQIGFGSGWGRKFKVLQPTREDRFRRRVQFRAHLHTHKAMKMPEQVS